ncbi:MAG: DUF1493 family protein [Rikenellaceae bacterium]|nr:DUF1493 family protein [Rikenellaceae bacterium]
MQEVSPRLIELIEGFTGKLPYPSPDRLSLYHDLGIYGDDAGELLEKYSENFGVSLEGFRFGRYFPHKGDWLPAALWRFITFRKPRQYERLTVGDLQKGIDEGKL